MHSYNYAHKLCVVHNLSVLYVENTKFVFFGPLKKKKKKKNSSLHTLNWTFACNSKQVLNAESRPALINKYYALNVVC